MSNFSFPHSVFKRLITRLKKTSKDLKQGLVWERVNTTYVNEKVENILRVKGKMLLTGNQDFLLFSVLFPTVSKTEIVF